MPPVGFEPKISTGERSQTYALDRATTGTDITLSDNIKCLVFVTEIRCLMLKATLYFKYLVSLHLVTGSADYFI